MTVTAAPERRQILRSLTGLLLALFVSTLASTVVSTALPRMLADLDGTATQYTWVVTATLLAATAATPIWGKLADLYSKKTLIQLATLVFVAGSLAAGFAQSGGQLIAARAVQGIGVGGLQPLVQIAIGAMIPPRERGRYYGAAVFLTQYFQVSRGHTPTEAGLLTIPMMAGILISSIVAGNLISRNGRIKPFLVAGSISLAAGFAVLGFVDAGTPMLAIGAAMVLIGAGVGMTLQNFVLVVQNAVPLSDIGAASATVAFFRSLGGTVGVAVLGAILARQVAGHTAGGASVPEAYGDATGLVFAISAGVALLGVAAAVLLKPVELRTKLDV